MARRVACALALALWVAAAVLPHGAARAQSLQRLTVDRFTLSADTDKPQLEVPFHLIVTLYVKQRVSAIGNLELPILAELELLGDERRLESSATGTRYVETIGVVAHRTGTISIAAATLQAIDARDGKPKQYFTNSLTLQVSGGSLEPIDTSQSFASAAEQLALRAILWTAGVACAIVLAVLFFRRRRPRPVPAAPSPVAAPPPQPPPPPVRRSPQDRLRDALVVLRADPTRECAVRVRAAVWQMMGASDGETLADVLQRENATDPRLRDVLRALERAAFTYDEDLSRAVVAACGSLERCLA